MTQMCRTAALLLLLTLAVPPEHAGAQQNPRPNPFGEFESFRLGNGLKVWFRTFPGATVTSMAVIVPAGFDVDPPGHEQTAHLLEHMLLSDRAGERESELVRALTARGGNYAGLTYADRTTYRVTIDTDEAHFGLQWLYGVIEPRAFSEALVNRNREPVAIEADIRPRGVAERITARFINDARLRPPSFWAREFGMPTAVDRNVDPFGALQSIRAEDLHSFYNAHYSPTSMTLVIVSGLPREALQGTLSQTFGVMPWRPESAPAQSAVPRTRETRRFAWSLARNTTLRVAYRIPAMTGQDQQRLMLIAGMLERRLMTKLRRGDVKAVYSITANLVTRGPASMLLIAATMNPDREGLVRGAIDDELARMKNATSDSAFYADRDALAQAMTTQFASPDALRALVTEQLYRPDLHAEFPDLGRYLTTAGADSIEAFARRTITADARILQLWRPPPVSFAWLGLAAALIVWLAARTYRAATLRLADMRAIRYVARLRPPFRALRWLLSAFIVVLVLRLLGATLHFVADFWLLGFDSVALHLVAAALVVFLLVLAAFTAAGRIRRKVLVFDDEVRIKSPTYRSAVIAGNSIARVTSRDDGDAGPSFLQRLQPPASPVTIHLRNGAQHTLFVRRPAALEDAIAALIRRSAPPETAPAAHTRDLRSPAATRVTPTT